MGFGLRVENSGFGILGLGFRVEGIVTIVVGHLRVC